MVYKIHIMHTNINVCMSTKTLTHTGETERQESENRFEMVFIC